MSTLIHIYVAIGTAVCGIAPSMNLLIAGRAIAGMGGGG
jgi:MFS family permease